MYCFWISVINWFWIIVERSLIEYEFLDKWKDNQIRWIKDSISANLNRNMDVKITMIVEKALAAIKLLIDNKQYVIIKR